MSEGGLLLRLRRRFGAAPLTTETKSPIDVLTTEAGTALTVE